MLFLPECNFVYEWSKPDFNRSYIYNIIELVLSTCGKYKMISFCEVLMVLGFKYVTWSGISLSKIDLIQSKYKSLLIRNMRLVVIGFLAKFPQSNIKFWNRIWSGVLDNIYNIINLDTSDYSVNQTSIQIMFNSGARGTLSQFKQLVGARGYAVGFNSRTCMMPILNSYFDGLNLIQFFCCTYSSRKDLMNTILKTPVSGYLTRRLVEVSRECVISEEDCNVKTGLYIKIVLSLSFIKNRLMGRFLAEPIIYNNRIVIQSNVLITECNILNILKYCNGLVCIRSPVMCQSKGGVCKLCYGVDLNLLTSSKLGNSVGVLAAQSIGEPGIQLTLRTFHGLNGIKYNRYDDDSLKNVLYAPCSGIVSLTNLSCVCTSFGNVIIVNINSVLSILNGNVVIWEQRLHRGACLLVFNNIYVDINKLLCFDYLSDGNCLSLVVGVLFLGSLIYNLNSWNALGNQIRFARYSISKYCFRESVVPSIYLRVGFIVLFYLVNKGGILSVLVGAKVNVFSILLVLLMKVQDVTRLSSFGGFSQLSKLFEGEWGGGDLVVSCVKGVLRYGDLSNDSKRIYVVDPVSDLIKPVVYFAYNRKCLLEDNEKLNYGQMIALGELEFLNYIDTYKFNKFLNHYIDVALRVYEFQGIDINSKHIEIVLRQMINAVSIVNEGDTSFICGRKYKFWDVFVVNDYISFISGRSALFSREIMGITSLCVRQVSILSSISFYGSVKSMLKALLIDGTCVLKGIKDNIILGDLSPMGTGFNKRF